MMGLPSAKSLQGLTAPPISQEAAFRALVLKAVYTAAVSGSTTTASISTSSTVGVQNEALFAALQSEGFTVTNSGSTITVGW